MDLDTMIRTLYLLGYNADGKFVTPEPLGPGGDPYPAMYASPIRNGWIGWWSGRPLTSANGKKRCW
ncbi:MAG: hypothetical protein PHR35_17770 [Kiritimatiellae bacterium]|nr:hypothetical protein [Kiritimatiellia bacterium]